MSLHWQADSLPLSQQGSPQVPSSSSNSAPRLNDLLPFLFLSVMLTELRIGPGRAGKEAGGWIRENFKVQVLLGEPAVKRWPGTD